MREIYKKKRQSWSNIVDVRVHANQIINFPWPKTFFSQRIKKNKLELYTLHLTDIPLKLFIFLSLCYHKNHSQHVQHIFFVNFFSSIHRQMFEQLSYSLNNLTKKRVIDIIFEC